MLPIVTYMAKEGPNVTRQARRKNARKQADLGPSNDPIRQQGRDPLHCYIREEWYVSQQQCDTSRATGRRRMYHESYQTSSGHTWDEFFEGLSAIASELEEAGINLGWGGCNSKSSQSIDYEIDRRYLDPKNNRFWNQTIKRGKA